MKRLVLELDDEIHSKIKIKAAQKNKTLKDIVTDLLRIWLKRKEK